MMGHLLSKMQPARETAVTEQNRKVKKPILNKQEL